jgi:hypothetical protein
MSNKFEANYIVENETELVECACDFLTDMGDRLFITEYGIALMIAEALENDDDDIAVFDKAYRKDSNTKDMVYVKQVAEDLFIIKNVFDEDGDMEEIRSDFILLQDGLLVDEVIDEYIDAREDFDIVKVDNEFKIIGIDYAKNDGDKSYSCCGECCGCRDEEDFYSHLDEAEKEFVDDISSDCGYSKEILAEVYTKGFNDGSETTLLVLADHLQDLAE